MWTFSQSANQREENGDGEKEPPHLTLDARSLHPAHSTTCVLIACSTHTRVPLPDNNNNNDAGAGAGAGRGAAKEKEKGSSRFGRACSVPEAGMAPYVTHQPSTSTSSAPSPSSLLPKLVLPLPLPHTRHPSPSSLLAFRLHAHHHHGPHSSQTRPSRTRCVARRNHRLPRGGRDFALFFSMPPPPSAERILTSVRPAEFQALAHLARGDARARIAAGRTSTVILTRHTIPSHHPSREKRRRRGKRDGVSDDRRDGEEGDRGVGAEARVRVWDRRCARGRGRRRRCRGWGRGERRRAGFRAGESDSRFPSSGSSSSGSAEREGSEESVNESGVDDGAKGAVEAEGDDKDNEGIVELDP
ncbi:hypothetical protein BJY52DRAFT_1222934 [Lactarius psammicola]|nr:hypothetical protein BJY52DRAFT_1222934 [Lactarius psammicola]